MVPILEFMVDWAMQIQGPIHVQTAGQQVCQTEDANFETAHEVDPFGSALLEKPCGPNWMQTTRKTKWGLLC